MELTVRPEDLAAAAARLAACRDELTDALGDFRAVSASAESQLGPAAEAAAHLREAAGHAVTTSVDNLDVLSRALSLLAEVYSRIDATAVGP